MNMRKSQTRQASVESRMQSLLIRERLLCRPRQARPCVRLKIPMHAWYRTGARAHGAPPLQGAPSASNLFQHHGVQKLVSITILQEHTCLRYAQDSSWREDNRRVSNSDRVCRIAELAMRRGKSVDFTSYWQRHVKDA